MRNKLREKKINNSIFSRINKFFYKNTNKVLILSLIILFFVINYALRFVPLRFDFTENHAYSLSSGTKKILRNLDDVVNINIYISSDLPTRLTVLEREVKDFLEEYRRSAKKSYVIIKSRDPKKDEEALKEVEKYGVPELQFSQIENDKYAVSTTYFSIVIQHGTKYEVIPSITNPASLEYDVTSAIYRLTTKSKPILGIVGEPSFAPEQQDNISIIRQIFNKDYEIVYPFNGEKKELTKDISTILVFSKNYKYNDEEIKVLEDFIKSGKSLIVFAQGLSVDGNLQPVESNHNLFNLLSKYGLTLEKKFVLSSSSELANFSTGTVTYFVPYPFWIKTSQFNPDVSEFSNIGYLFFPWASPVTSKKINNIETVVMTSTEKNSWSVGSNISLNPNDIAEPNKKDIKQIPLVYKVKKDKGIVYLIPSERFLDDQFLSRATGNLDFVFNLVNITSSDGLLSGIRSRQSMIVPLKQVPDDIKDLIKIISIGFLPGLVTVIGVVYLLKKR